MSVTSVSYGDPLDKLPSDNTPPTPDEAHIVDALFKNRITATGRILTNAKDVVTAGVIFLIVSLPQVSSLLEKFIPLARSKYALLVIKMGLFMILYFVATRLYLARVPK